MRDDRPGEGARGWLVPVSTAFALSSVVTLFLVSSGPGCQTRCFNKFDCGEGSYCSPLGRCETECFTDLDCRQPPECLSNPSACQPRGLRCNSVGRCVGNFSVKRPDKVRPPGEDNSLPTEIEGWDSSPGLGHAFIVNNLAIAGRDRGFDLDGSCDPQTGSCIDNILWQLGELGNDQIKQGLLGGESLLLLELAGLDTPYRGDDRSLTVKIYGARDADDPFFPANNFKVPPGHTTCCEFKISPQSIVGPPPQARARAPAKIERGRLFSLAPVPVQFTLTVGQPPHPDIRLEKVLVAGRLPSTLREISDGLLGAAVPMSTLAQTDNPYCKTVSPRCTMQFTDSTLLDLVATLFRPYPDIDLDIPPDGLECVLDTDGDGRVDRCCDGNGFGVCADASKKCNRAEIPPLDPNEPWTCGFKPAMADGYSIAVLFSAVNATVVGVGQ